MMQMMMMMRSFFLDATLFEFAYSNSIMCFQKNSGNPSLRQGKPGSGVGLGYGLRFKSQLGQVQVDYAINGFQQKTLYFHISKLAS